MQSILGIDVSKDTLDVVLNIEGGSFHKIISNDIKGYQNLEKWLKSHRAGELYACLEATGQYGEPMAEYLFESGHRVSIVNPARIKRYGESKLHRNKTDKADAALIAELCQKEKPALWQPLNPQKKHLKALIRRLADQKTHLQQEINRLKSGKKDKWVLSDLQAHLDYLRERIKQPKKRSGSLLTKYQI